ncbi:virion structural protein [Salmonella phage Se-J]|uniref:virion structural protein n=1 Tax=Salmonella phage Se-J TaxID=2698910 RepID=UPI0018AFD9E7|nr:virion structural protein [Salmonella phage Se-J]
MGVKPTKPIEDKDMRGVKVQGHASMLRSSSCPGAIIYTDHAAGMAALQARQRNETREATIVEQSNQISNLEATIKMMAEKLGIEIPEGGQNGDAS